MSRSKIFAELASQDVSAVEFGVLDGGIPETVSLLATSNFTSSTASVSFDGHFSSTYRNYQVLASNITLVAGSGTPSIDARFRRSGADVTASDYLVAGVRLYITDGSLGAIGLTGQNHMKISHENTRSTAGHNTSFMLYLYDPLGTNNYKNATFHTMAFDAGAANRHHFEVMSGTLIDSTAALTGISFLAGAGSDYFLRGNFKLYGIR